MATKRMPSTTAHRAAAVGAVGDRAADEREQEPGERAGGGDERDTVGESRERCREERHRREHHAVAEVRDGARGPEPGEVASESPAGHRGRSLRATGRRSSGRSCDLRHAGRRSSAAPIPFASALMAAFPELAILRTELSGDALAHLERLAVSWRLLADLSFSDLLLFAPVAHEDGHRFVILAQVRPTTGQTLYVHDLVGEVVDEVERPSLARAWRHAEIHDGEATVVRGRERVRVRDACRCGSAAGRSRCSPARRPPPRAGGRASSSATTSRSTTCSPGWSPRARSRSPARRSRSRARPRAGDGVIVLDADGGMRYASPNAVSSLHRLGIHAYTSGVRLGEIGFDEAAVDTAVRGRLPVIEEVEREEASVLVRVIPLMDKWKSAGALVLLRDVTDLRRRDRMLMSKDATIREIHHRVKNNLQTLTENPKPLPSSPSMSRRSR